jgi:hypothetical protein
LVPEVSGFKSEKEEDYGYSSARDFYGRRFDKLSLGLIHDIIYRQRIDDRILFEAKYPPQIVVTLGMVSHESFSKFPSTKTYSHVP